MLDETLAEGTNVPALRVLVADGERDAAMNLGIFLRSEGMDVRVAVGGASVARTVEDFRPHAIVLDVASPDRSALARELKARYAERCPVLIAVATQYGDEHKKLAALDGFRYFVPKPYDADALLKLIASIEPGQR